MTTPEILTKAVGPMSRRFPTDNDTSLSKQIFNIGGTFGETMVNSDRVSNDLTRITEALQACKSIGKFMHSCVDQRNVKQLDNT